MTDNEIVIAVIASAAAAAAIVVVAVDDDIRNLDRCHVVRSSSEFAIIGRLKFSFQQLPVETILQGSLYNVIGKIRLSSARCLQPSEIICMYTYSGN